MLMEDEDRQRRVAKLVVSWKGDVCKFLRDVFPHHFSKEFADFHRDIFNVLGKFRDPVKDVSAERTGRVAIAAPRRHGKTEVITFGWVMWNLLLNDSNNLTIIIANNYNNAIKFLIPIKEELEHNELLREVFGDLRSDKWSENEIELSSRKKVIVGGNEFKIRGVKYLHHRPDMMIIDDAEDDELVLSEVRREKFEHWLLYGVEPAMTQDDNQIVFVGTVLHRASQLSKLMIGEGKYRGWEKRFYTALVGKDEDKALWEDGVPYKWLIEERNKDPYKFSQEYMNNPVPSEGAMFKEEYFDNYQDSDLPTELVVNVTVDLACSDKNYSDYTVIMPCGVDVNGDLWVLPYKRGQYVDPDVIINDILSMCNKYYNHKTWKLGKLGIEKNGFQRFLARNFNRVRKSKGMHFPVYEIDAKGDKIQRIAQLQPWFASGDIHVRMEMLDLKQELLDFPRAMHDDVCDSLAHQLEFVQHKAHKKVIKDEKWKVTPEMQRKKVLDKRLAKRKPKIYSKFTGLGV